MNRVETILLVVLGVFAACKVMPALHIHFILFHYTACVAFFLFFYSGFDLYRAEMYTEKRQQFFLGGKTRFGHGSSARRGIRGVS